MEKIIKEIENELISRQYECSMLGNKTYADGIYKGLKIAKQIVEREVNK